MTTPPTKTITIVIPEVPPFLVTTLIDAGNRLIHVAKETYDLQAIMTVEVDIESEKENG